MPPTTSIRAFFRLTAVLTSAIQLLCGAAVTGAGIWAVLENGGLVTLLGPGEERIRYANTKSSSNTGVNVTLLSHIGSVILAIGCLTIFLALITLFGTMLNTRSMLLGVSIGQLAGQISLAVAVVVYLVSFDGGRLEAGVDDYRQLYDCANKINETDRATVQDSRFGALVYDLHEFVCE